MKTFGDRLREARIAAGLTQEQLGFSLGVTKSSISAWENDRETPSFKLLPELRRSLRRPLDELVCGIAPDANLSEDKESLELRATTVSEKTLLTRYRALPAKRRDAILELLKPAGVEVPNSGRRKP